MLKMEKIFNSAAETVAHAAGRPLAFALCVAAVLAWALSGPVFQFSETWQLIINTGTTIITFLMVFLIQNTQNRDSKAMHLKLDELIRSNSGARNSLIDLEDLAEEEIQEIQDAFQHLHGSDNENIRNFAQGLKEHLDNRGGGQDKEQD